MLYVFVFFFQLIGVGFHVGQRVIEIDKRIEGDTWKDVINVFVKENLISLFISALVLLSDIMIHLALSTYTDIPSKPITVPVLEWNLPFAIVAILWSWLMGYAGQRIIYSILGKAEHIVIKKVEEKQ